MSKKRITIKDIARLTGLSVASVSMALNNDPRVAENTKRLVLETAEKLDYVPDSIGRALSSKRIGAIAVVIPHSSHSVFSHPYFNEIFEGVTEVANNHDFTIILSTSSGKQEEEDAYVKLLRTRRADGCIVASASIKDENIYRLESFGYQVVVLGRRDNYSGVSVTIDDMGGAEQVVTHLIEKHGLRRIAHISGPLGHRSAVDRLEGYRNVLGRHGIPYDENLVMEGDFSQESGEFACRQLLERKREFDAIFAANDEMAFASLKVLEEHAIEVPSDVALVGFDDISFSRIIKPPLTTVSQPMTEVGRLAATRLIDLLDGKTVEPDIVEFPTKLVVRKSCGC